MTLRRRGPRHAARNRRRPNRLARARWKHLDTRPAASGAERGLGSLVRTLKRARFRRRSRAHRRGSSPAAENSTHRATVLRTEPRDPRSRRAQTPRSEPHSARRPLPAAKARLPVAPKLQIDRSREMSVSSASSHIQPYHNRLKVSINYSCPAPRGCYLQLASVRNRAARDRTVSEIHNRRTVMADTPRIYVACLASYNGGRL